MHADISPPHTSIIILNWNNWRDTLACLTSLRHLSTTHVSLIICDNASNDDSITQLTTWLKTNFSPDEWLVLQAPISIFPTHLPPITLLQTGKNLGFAGGNNVGIRYVLTVGHSSFIWLLNNDTQIEAQALNALLTCATARPDIALWGSTIIDYTQRQQVQCAGGCQYYPWLSHVVPFYSRMDVQQLMQLNPVLKLDYIFGASLFFRADILRTVGLLNEDYFLFYEELDYSQRLKKAGYQIDWCKNSWVYHKGSATIGAGQKIDRQKLQRANYYENLSTLKYTARFHPYHLLFVSLLRFTLKSILLLKRRDFDLFPSLWRAYRDFWQWWCNNI
ncbi:glycosyltransferase family 2 protein [Beggiatoa leptomitoformis]|uniref:Glycosyltransferase n=1 Tax=Beggiatoa leptomitoformis TaxID=288004 RepID=A0A2N9YIM1_9GAMM|nr:glycosyltransferase family 2 protein [Beggiatoa leptomitoformis]ALG67427.1 glycosyltransferase [Beggiatoa leptomitoformis]AUI70357.1 glycosyltransferase [Beggiatoa leptomitoformis]